MFIQRFLPRTAGRMLLLSGILLSAPGAVAAQGWMEPVRPGIGVARRVETDVRVTIRGPVAEVVVDEWFQNQGSTVAEGDYLYPLSVGVALSGASLYQGETELRGEVMDAAQARGIYEAIVRRRRDPALIEYAGEGLFRARVFPIAPGERRRVTLRFTQVLETAGGSLHFRTLGALRPGGNGSEASNSRELAPVRVEIRVAGGEGFLDAFSPTHGLNQERDRDDLLVRLTETAPTGPVSIFLPRRERLAGVTVVAHRPAGDDGYALLSLTPPAVGGASQPRDVVVVTDVSGSMSGAKMEQARAAILRVLDGLGSADRFRLISFSNAVTPADEGWVEATPDGRARARSWVNRLRADGGTNIDGALTEAFRLRPGRGRLPVVLFLTDGLPSVGEQDPRRLADAAASRRGDFRVFAFGVGHDVNTRLLDGLSAATRGSTQYVQPGENVERAVSLLAQQISHPVLTDLRIEGSPVRLTEIYPVDIPDLFSGENLVLLARYAADGRGSVTFTGSRGESRVRVTADAEFPRREDRNDYLPRLWAARKLGHLTRQLWLEGESPALVEEIRSTALRYGLPSPFTSILVQEPQALDVVVGTRSPAPAAVRREAERRVMSAAEQATGAGAVGMAESARDFRSAARADQLDELSAPSVSAGGRSRILAGRVFVAQDGVWKDVEADAGSPLVSVRRYSRAWFQVVAALPELEDVARAGDDFEVGGKGMRLRFDDAGEETLDERALSRIVRAFR